MNWIRVATKMKGDPRLGAIAAGCKVRVAEAVGLVCCVLMELPDHARDGDVADVPDVIIEQWAMWGGKPGRFAAAFRAELCDETGVVRAWEHHNGAAIREAEAARARMREARKKPKPAERVPERSPDVRRTFAERSPHVPQTFASNGTERNDTTPTETVGAVRGREEPDRPAAAGRVAYQAQYDELLAAGLPHERAALQALVQHHPAPDVLVLELHATASGLHVVRGQHTGRAADIADVMRAVAEMAASAKPFTVSLFRGFARRVADRPPEPPSAEEREAAKLARQIAVAQPAVAIEAPRTAEELEQLRAQREAAMARFRAEFHRHTTGDAAA